ncbi:AzlD family protein [Mangrovibrevibacter kandeliae]|uniref:AzlD family protein n=1 Tax=Mangrovibrevibacter kandeliae TaxID=2968473 RepID=UPI0021192F81|nr:AzlD domain-containing protein [Aurantimonas sp. CSK15Z-1]MCQ8783976.1 AzlD domain-containing protein [Aurantimonas sp. CSK15Z-1]
MSEIWWIVLLGGGLTYLTRSGGHLVLSRFERVPPRLAAALNAVPAAVLTTLVAPVLLTGDWPERVAIVLSLFLALRLPLIATVALGTAMVALARAAGL